MDRLLDRIGIMHGRLSPPINGRLQAFPKNVWAQEFALAQAAGLACVEWVFDLYGATVNPLASLEGVRQMKRLARRCGIEVRSVCADYFMDRPLLRAPRTVLAGRLDRLRWLLRQCAAVGIQRVVLPFVDRSEIRTDGELAIVVASLRAVVPLAQRLGVELHLETSLPPDRFRVLLEQLETPTVKVTYDIGNSAALAYDPTAELAAYGERVGSVHVKDRRRHGPSVSLGEGAADFPTCFAVLRALGYQGDLILQVARGVAGEELAWARRNRDFVVSHWMNA